MRRRNRITVFFLAALAFLFCVTGQSPAAQGAQKGEMTVFYSPTCHRCEDVERNVLPKIAREFKDILVITYRSTSEVENYKLLVGLQEQHGVRAERDLPVFYLNGHFFSAKSANVYAQLKDFINGALRDPRMPAGNVPAVDLLMRFKLFGPLAVAGAGLIDGINPCAFTVMVFFMSFLILQGYRRYELIVIGLSFILSVTVTYVLIGIGLFGFLYQLKGFWLVSRALNLAIGTASFALGVLALYDFFKFKKTGAAAGLALQLPQAVKNRIHRVIGLAYRSGRQGAEGAARPGGLFGLSLAALATGFTVSLLEAVCTGQVYLPTLVFVFKTTSFKWQAFGYILLYNLMFIVPLFIIFLLALLGFTSEEFSRALKNRLGLIKLLMAALFFGLGFALIYAQLPGLPGNDPGEAAGVSAPSPERVPGDSFTWDFGRVKEGAVLKHDFVLKNDGAKTLTIEAVDSSCGCTVPQITKKMLLPGEETAVGVQFNTKGYVGPTQQFVYVHTNSLDNPVLRFIIKADIAGPDKGPGAKE